MSNALIATASAISGISGVGEKPMIHIAITAEAFEAIAATMPLGSVGYENEADERGERLVWLDPNVISRLRAMRGPGESYSDVILRLAVEGASS